jgi:hypothetical protein
MTVHSERQAKLKVIKFESAPRALYFTASCTSRCSDFAPITCCFCRHLHRVKAPMPGNGNALARLEPILTKVEAFLGPLYGEPRLQTIERDLKFPD